jgi:hypothetical protein
MTQDARPSQRNEPDRRLFPLVVVSQRIARMRARCPAPRSNPCCREVRVDCFVASHTTVVVRLDRTIQFVAAFRLFSGVSGILGRPVKPGDDECECGACWDRHCEPTGRANARPMTGSAKQSMLPRSKCGLLRRFAPRNDVAPTSNMTPRSRGRICPRYARTLAPPRIEGAGNAGRTMRRSLARRKKKGTRA